jgi:putative DNA primase/helicase
MSQQPSPQERLACLQPAPQSPPPMGGSQAPDETEQERFTDVGNARRLVRDHGQDLRWVPTWSTWLAWDQKRWRPDTKGEVVQRAKRVAAALWEEAAAANDSERRKQAGRWAMQSESAQRIEAMIRLARTEPGIPVEAGELDADPWLLNTTTGTLDLRTGQLQPHRRSDLITKITAAGYNSTAECPAWERFLEQVVPDEDVRSFLQRAVGYALTGLTNEHALFFFHGAGANGKSTFLRTLLTVLGDYGRQAEPDLLLAKRDAHPTGVADLFGARLVVSSEIEDGRRLAEGTVKQLTGGDVLKARFMRQDFFEFSPTHTLFLAANHRPVVRGTDHAIWRRLHLVPFTVTIPAEDQDIALGERLKGEMAGVLRWAVAGCLEWRARGLASPLAVQLATSSYRADMDQLGAFIDERCVVLDGAVVPAAQLYEAYQTWTHENGERVTTQRELGVALSERGFDRRKHGSKRRWHWFGIGLQAEAEPMNPPDPESRLSA